MKDTASTKAAGCRIDCTHEKKKEILAQMSAQKVQVEVRRARYDMPKGPDGVWTVTTPPLVVSFHYYDLTPIPQGEVRARLYFSKGTGRRRRCCVYTPPDYDTNTGTRHPVLYPQIPGDHATNMAASSGTVLRSPGTAHEWLTWRRSLYRFAPLLFRD